MNVLLTGGAGYIGSHVADLLVGEGHRVVVFDNLYSGFSWAVPRGAEFVQGDVTSAADLERVFGLCAFDVVMHFAAYTQVGESVREPLKYYLNNTMGTARVLAAMRAAGVRKFVFSSTAAVYDGGVGRPVLETDVLRPESPYGFSKLFSEKLIGDLAVAWPDFKFMILRYFNVAGAHPDGHIGQATTDATHLIKVAVQAACGLRSSVEIYGTDYPTEDGTCVRDYIHVMDLAQAHLLASGALMAGGPSEIYNVGYGRGYSVREVLGAVERVSGVALRVVSGARRAGDLVSVVADNGKIRRDLNFVSQFADLDLICKTAYQFEKSRMGQG